MTEADENMAVLRLLIKTTTKENTRNKTGAGEITPACCSYISKFPCHDKTVPTQITPGKHYWTFKLISFLLFTAAEHLETSAQKKRIKNRLIHNIPDCVIFFCEQEQVIFKIKYLKKGIKKKRALYLNSLLVISE